MESTARNLFALSNLRVSNNLPEILAVTSGKGGVGKTNISVNIAILFKKLKKKVLLIDADIHLGNVDLFLGIRPVHTIADVLTGTVDLQKVIIQGPGNIDILPASSAVLDVSQSDDDNLRKLNDAFAKFEHEYDTVVVDTGAGISRNVLSFVLGADKVVLVVTPDPAAIADAYGVVKVLKRSHMETPIIMIANMVSSEEEGESLYKKMSLMVQRFLESEITFGGALLRDNQVVDSIRRQRPLVLEHPSSTPTHTFKVITHRLLRLPSIDAGKRTPFFNRVMNNRNIIVGGAS